MHWFLLPVLLAAFVPWIFAWRGAGFTSLRHALVWMIAAWLWWILLGFLEAAQASRYLALSLTACAGVAVLGARRPHVGAWNFVVLGLLAVMLVPILESFVLGTPTPGPLRLLFLAATLAISVANYLPTRFGLAATVIGGASAVELCELCGIAVGHEPATLVAILFTPWLAWLGWSVPPRTGSPLDQTWRDFRDRFGLFWGLRTRELFNLAARNAGSQARLSWSGLNPAPLTREEQATLEHTLAALLKRFGS